ncbi:MAG: hypothetical protein J6W16_01355 [Methanobrevibacter sp.]|nr:hypothetical protein [Methanobrevibacter sp.]
MDMTKNFVYAKESGIIFCPDDVLYVDQHAFSDWDSNHAEYVEYSTIVFENTSKLSFEQKYFPEILNLITEQNLKPKFID